MAVITRFLSNYLLNLCYAFNVSTEYGKVFNFKRIKKLYLLGKISGSRNDTT
jgi:hypothetical protein